MPNPIHQRDRHYSTAIDAADVAVIGELITAGWSQSRSLVDSFSVALDQGHYLASKRQWYRIGNIIDQEQRPPVATRKARKAVRAPILSATGPGQVWMWDVTDLKGPYRGVNFKAYSVQDMYSRKIVAWALHRNERDKYAKDLFTAAFTEGPPTWLHSDNGSGMISNDLSQVCTKFKVKISFNRPSVSNDNPFKESEFRTLKSRPGYPQFFKSYDDALQWMAGYVEWFNTEHHHSALGLHTPNSVHTGQWVPIQAAREKTIMAYFHAHPERYRRSPVMKTPPKEVGINLHLRPTPQPAKTAD